MTKTSIKFLLVYGDSLNFILRSILSFLCKKTGIRYDHFCRLVHVRISNNENEIYYKSNAHFDIKKWTFLPTGRSICHVIKLYMSCSQILSLIYWFYFKRISSSLLYMNLLYLIHAQWYVLCKRIIKAIIIHNYLNTKAVFNFTTLPASTHSTYAIKTKVYTVL
jgi:hypothetical protein